MRSVRLDDALDERIRRAAHVEGSSVSDFIRSAAAERAERILATRPGDRLSDVIAAVGGGRPQARHTGDAFAEILLEKRRRRSR